MVVSTGPVSVLPSQERMHPRNPSSSNTAACEYHAAGFPLDACIMRPSQRASPCIPGCGGSERDKRNSEDCSAAGGMAGLGAWHVGCSHSS